MSWGARNLISTQLVAVLFNLGRLRRRARRLGHEDAVANDVLAATQDARRGQAPVVGQGDGPVARHAPACRLIHAVREHLLLGAAETYGVDARRVTQGGDGRWCVRVRVERGEAHGALAGLPTCVQINQ